MVVLALSGSVAADVVAMVLLGLGFIWIVSLVFFVIGRGEDAERAASSKRRGPGPSGPPARAVPPRAPLPRRRDHD